MNAAPLRERAQFQGVLEEIARAASQPWAVMAVEEDAAGQQASRRLGPLLPEGISFVPGPASPVSLAPVELIDRAIDLALQAAVIVCAPADLLEAPGTSLDLLSSRSLGADVRAVYAPSEALALAKANPGREVVLVWVGFEDTAPAIALAALRATREDVPNFSVLAAHLLVPAALRALLVRPRPPCAGFVVARSLCAVSGPGAYRPLCRAFHVPVVLAGSEPVDLLRALLDCVRQLETGRAAVEGDEGCAAGNPVARALIRQTMRIADLPWRGLGVVRDSGWVLRPEFGALDALRRYPAPLPARHAYASATSGQRPGALLLGSGASACAPIPRPRSFLPS